jgi:hypothetical protein
MKVLSFIFLCFFITVSCEILPSYIKYDKSSGSYYYIVKIAIGNPSFKYKLVVDFSSNNLILGKHPSQHSLSWSDDRNVNTEILCLRDCYRIEFKYNQKVYESVCRNCDGIIGFGKKSFFWKLFSGVLFKPNYIEFYSNQTPKIFDCSWNTLECINDEESKDRLCEVPAKFDNKEMRFSWNPTPQMYLPEQILSKVSKGKNIYTTKTLPDLKISFNPNQQHGCEKKTDTPYSINLNEQLTKDSKSDTIFNAITSPRNNVITSGVIFQKNFDIYYDNVNQKMVVKNFSRTLRFSSSELMVLAVIIVFIIRFKTSRGNCIFDSDEGFNFYDYISYFYQIFGLILIPITLNLPNIWNTLSRELVPTWISISVLIINAVIQVFMISCSIAYKIEHFSPLKKFHNKVIFGIVNSFTHQYVLIYCSVFILTERSVDGISSILICVAQTGILQIFVLSMIQLSIYYLGTNTTKVKVNATIIYTIWISVSFIIQNFVTWTYYFKPVLNQYLDQLQVPNAGIIYYFIYLTIIWFSVFETRCKFIKNLKHYMKNLASSKKKE